MRFMRNGAVLAALGFAALGCADAGDQPGSEGVSDDLIAQLQETYPSLGETPAPEPQPGASANPTQIPDRLRDAASARALEAATGEATFYADMFEGRRTASGIPFRQNQMVAAHRSFPFGTLLRVTNLGNDRSANVRVVDRGPFGGGRSGQPAVIDLSRRAADQLGFINAGRANVRVEVMEWGDGLPQTS
ncbi:MAG: septal ring lytic transglycosylase RlpA family protein [Gemmatimonadota bacterium]